MFSDRTGWDRTESELARRIRETRAAGRRVYDLTISNPTRCGFDYPADVLDRLTVPGSLVYDPEPCGLAAARQAVAAYCGSQVSPDQVLLTTSTSEAYSFLFRLLASPGDEVLVGQPGYPLFDFVAALDGIELVSYPLFEDFGWWIDFATLESRVTERTRALLLVHPNNPTGHATSPAERIQLEELCVRHNLALIVDEVFLDFTLGHPIASFAVPPHPCLTFVVSGLSKIAALPQMKVAWLTVFGPDGMREEALGRLEIVADTFLSLNAPAQHALPGWLDGRHGIQGQILGRVRANLSALEGLLGDRVLRPAAGWNALVRCRRTHAAERLFDELGVLVHPGSFYGFPADRFLVLSLLAPQPGFLEGVQRLSRWMDGMD